MSLTITYRWQCDTCPSIFTDNHSSKMPLDWHNKKLAEGARWGHVCEQCWARSAFTGTSVGSAVVETRSVSKHYTEATYENVDKVCKESYKERFVNGMHKHMLASEAKPSLELAHAASAIKPHAHAPGEVCNNPACKINKPQGKTLVEVFANEPAPDSEGTVAVKEGYAAYVAAGVGKPPAGVSRSETKAVPAVSKLVKLIALAATLVFARADTVRTMVTVPFSPTNGPTFYRIVKTTPPEPYVAPPAPGPWTNSEANPTLDSATARVRTPFGEPVAATNQVVIDVAGATSLLLATNWTDIPPAGLPATSDLSDSGRGTEYGTLVTNRVLLVVTEGVIKPVVLDTTTNSELTLTRTYRFKRVHEPGVQTLRRHR